MMNKKTVLSLSMLVTATIMVAETKDLNTNIDIAQAMSQGYKTEIVDMPMLIESSEYGKQAMKELEDLRSSFGKEISDKQQKIAQMEKSFNEKGPMMNQSAQATEGRKIKEEKEELQMLANRKQEQWKEKYMISMDDVVKQATDAVSQIASKDNVDVVVDRASGRPIFVSERMMKTDKYMKQLNENYKIAHNKSSTKLAAGKTEAAKKTA